MKIPRTVSDGKEALDDMAVVLRFKYQVLEMETRVTYTLGIIIPFVDTFSLRFGMFFCKNRPGIRSATPRSWNLCQNTRNHMGRDSGTVFKCFFWMLSLCDFRIVRSC